MDLTKTLFRTIDKTLNKKQNSDYKPEGTENVIVTRDVVYDEDDVKNCKLDYYYLPHHEGKFPVMFYIHGGGFVAGGKKYRRTISKWFATQGFFVVCMNYGLCPNCRFPQPIRDIVKALEWLKRSATYFRLDLSRVVVGGDSAGAYYASMIAALGRNKKMRDRLEVYPPVMFKAALLNCGLYDLEECMKKEMALDLNGKLFEAFTGYKGKFEDFEYKDCCSPLPYMHKNFPPCFLVHADKDVFCGGQAEILIEKLEQEDVYYERYRSLSPLRNHCFSLEWTTKEAIECNELIVQFLAKYLGGTLPERLSEASERVDVTAE